MRLDHQRRWFRPFGYAAAVLAGVVMGLSWVVFKLELNSPDLGPAEVNWLNMIALTAIVWPVYLVRNRENLFPRDMPYRWLGLFALFAASIFYFRNVGVDICGATTAAIVSRIETVFVFVLSYLVLRQAVSGLGWIGSLVLLAGALRTIGIGSGQMSFELAGVLALVVAAVFIALNAVIIKLHFNRVPNEMVILASATVQMVVFSTIVPLTGDVEGVLTALHDPQILALVAAGALCIGGNLFLYYYAMKRVPMWAVRILALVALPAAVLGDHFLLGQPVTASAIEGMLLVMLGATLVVLSGRAARDHTPEEAVTAEGDQTP